MPVVFVDSFAVERDDSDEYKEDEVATFNYEADTLTRFLAQNEAVLPFAEAIMNKVRNYFDSSIVIEEEGFPVELSL